jgi:predicted phage-related endonuclease
MTTQPDVTLNRHLGIGGSDARRILEGNWFELYQEKVGEAEPADLTQVFRVQLGKHTEDFHLDWIERREIWQIGMRNHRIDHSEIAFMFCHIDGRVHSKECPIEVKHSNGRANARDAAIYYMAQLQHILACTGDDQIYFSVIAGNEEPELALVSRNNGYIADLIDLETNFWWHVENRVPPEITPTGKQEILKVVAANTTIDGLKPYDMTGNNQWANLSIDYNECKAAAARFETAKKELKELVPPDASQATGHGVTVKRDRRGALRFS